MSRRPLQVLIPWVLAFTALHCAKRLEVHEPVSASGLASISVANPSGLEKVTKMEVTISEDKPNGQIVAFKEFLVGDQPGMTVEHQITVKPGPIVLKINGYDSAGTIVYSTDYCPEKYLGSLKMQLMPGPNSISPVVCHKDQSKDPITQGPLPKQGPTQRPPPQVWTSFQQGFATRYWDCCKPHCGWPTNVHGNTNPVRTCSLNNISHQTDFAQQNGCDGGDGFTCYNMAPWVIDAQLAYGFAAVPASGDICGKCYELRFTGEGRDGPDAGSAKLASKRMIVQATNIGSDVGSGQFDLLIPGGGVGLFNGCSRQWNIPASALGEQYGGFLSSCKKKLGSNASPDAYKDCVRSSCSSVFSQPNRADMLRGCMWFVDWFEVADNPKLHYNEVACPQDINGISFMIGGSPLQL